jgi:hypothetical protein
MFTEKEKECIKTWYDNVNKKRCAKNKYSTLSERELWIKQNPCPFSDKIKTFYNSGYGYKLLAKELNLTYSVIRLLCNKHIGFETRKGYNIVTEKLKEIRSKNAKMNNPFLDWPRKRPRLLEKNAKSIQGYYVKKDGTKVWLRSTYEYIIAKWLDKLNVDWKVEVKTYELKNGENYRPDFFIYNNEKLMSIIEVKSRYFNKENREYKFHMLKEEYDIDCLLITDITKFTNKTYHQELKEWKKQRSLED